MRKRRQKRTKDRGRATLRARLRSQPRRKSLTRRTLQKSTRKRKTPSKRKPSRFLVSGVRVRKLPPVNIERGIREEGLTLSPERIEGWRKRSKGIRFPTQAHAGIVLHRVPRSSRPRLYCLHYIIWASLFASGGQPRPLALRVRFERRESVRVRHRADALRLLYLSIERFQNEHIDSLDIHGVEAFIHRGRCFQFRKRK